MLNPCLFREHLTAVAIQTTVNLFLSLTIMLLLCICLFATVQIMPTKQLSNGTSMVRTCRIHSHHIHCKMDIVKVCVPVFVCLFVCVREKAMVSWQWQIVLKRIRTCICVILHKTSGGMYSSRVTRSLTGQKCKIVISGKVAQSLKVNKIKKKQVLLFTWLNEKNKHYCSLWTFGKICAYYSTVVQ